MGIDAILAAGYPWQVCLRCRGYSPHQYLFLTLHDDAQLWFLDEGYLRN